MAEQTFHYNHQIFEDHKVTTKSHFFATENQLTFLEKEDSKRFFNLNGDWKFNWVKDPKQRPNHFSKSKL